MQALKPMLKLTLLIFFPSYTHQHKQSEANGGSFLLQVYLCLHVSVYLAIEVKLQ